MVSWRILNLVSIYQMAALALVSAVAYFASPTHTLAVFIGGAFGTVNFWALRHLVQAGFGRGGQHKMLYIVFLGFKMVTALAVMAGLLIILKLHPLAFATGLSTMFVGLMVAVMHAYLRPLAQQQAAPQPE